MKITIDLSPIEIKRLGELVNADFQYGWIPLMHTTDDVAFSIHKLINMIDFIDKIDCENEDCEFCEFKEECRFKDNDNDNKGGYNVK